MHMMEISTAPTLATFVPALDHAFDFAADRHHNAIETEADADARETAFANQLLAALAAMAVRSKRRQADLCAALQRAGLERNPDRVSNALRRLEQDGCIEHLVPLYDGGILMSVTSRGIEKLSVAPRWNMLDGAGALRL